MCSYCTADLHLCFRIGKNLVFMMQLVVEENWKRQKNCYVIIEINKN